MAPLEKALFAVPQKDRNSCIVARHYGFDGKGGANFQRIGNEFGLTRERVRQIVSDADPLSHLLPKGFPLLDRIITSIAGSLPAPAALIEAKLQQTGATARAFRVEGLVSVAHLLSRAVPFRVVSLSKTRYVVRSAYPLFSDIVTQARQEVRKHGMATIAEFLVAGRGSEEAEREAALLESVLGGQRDFRWLDKKGGWFWLSATPRNCAVSRIRKMLAVANPLPVAELRAGLERMESPLAPEKTLLEFCRQIPGISVAGDIVRATPDIRAAEVLNKTEQDIYQLLSENNGCMSNSELICQSNVLGMKRPTFYQCVTYSPIVARFNRNHYRLIGAPVQNFRPEATPEATA